MAIRTAPTAIAVVSPAISIIRRTRAIRAACSFVGSWLCWGKSVVSVMPDSIVHSSIAHSAQRLEVVVAGDEGSARLDRVLAQRLPELSRSRLKTLIQAGHVQIGQPETGQATIKAAAIRDPAYHVAKGDTITIDVPAATDPAPRGEDIALDIVYEDGDIIVIDKPAGLVVHPAAGHESGTLVNALIAHCGASLSGIGGVKRPGIVHRLDKDTSGLLVVAKTDRAHQSLTRQFADHGRTGALRRGYLALCWGTPTMPSGTVDQPIGRHATAREKMAVRSQGREALTHWRRLETFAGRDGKPVAASVALELETGRTHQIRVHMSHLGHPLLGDATYGAGFKTKASQLAEPAQAELARLGRQALHAYRLALEHPTSGEILEFETDWPDDLARLRRALKGQHG